MSPSREHVGGLVRLRVAAGKLWASYWPGALESGATDRLPSKCLLDMED